jgi:hypothetical protein
MSRFQLKMLAVITMIIDHTGAILFPNLLILRIIGRLSFPIYAYFISEGFIYTSNINKYLIRLFAFAVISEVPYDLAFHGAFYYPGEQNIFFTLFLGLAAIAALENYYVRLPLAAAFLAAAATLLAWILRTDYGWFGVLSIILFYCFKKYRLNGLFVFSAANTGFSLLTSRIQLFAAAACIPIYLYNGKRGRYGLKYFFYSIYPVHLLLLFFIHTVVN